MSKPRLGTQRYRFRPFEDESHLECLCRLNFRGRNVGAYLLKHQRQYSLVFGFRSRGIHTQLQPGQAEPMLKRLEDGLKGFRPGDRLRIHWRSFADDKGRQQSLETLIQTTATLESQFLLLAQQRATRDLTTEKQRQPKQLYLFATYPLGAGQEQSADHVEKLLAWVVSQYDTFKGLKEQNQQQSYVQLLTQGFTDGYLHWEQQLNARMGLRARPMGVDDLWQYLWGQFNTTKAPTVPQCLELSEADGPAKLNEIIHDPIHSVSRLIRGENGQPSHPKADRQWVQVKGKFVGAVVLESKPAGFTTPDHQLYYLWQALAQFPDCECVCELAAADRMMTRVTLQRLTKQSVTATFRANLLRDVDVASQMRMKQGVEAQERIYEGALPIWISGLVLLHRDSPESLAEACQKLTNAFHQGDFIRETEIAWQLWLRSLPIVGDRLIDDGRRQMYLTNEAPGLMPVACPRTIDNQGIELITRDGKMPVYLDFVNQHRGMLIFGETRSGKSVLAAEIFVWAIANGMNVISLDYPKPDGTTTYTDLVKFFGDQGAYFDIGSESNNLFQIPDLRNLPDNQRQERLDDYKEFLVKALDTMVMGTETDNQLGKRVHTVLWQALSTFFETPQILARYDAGFEDGFSSSAWQQMPTLADFVETVVHLDLEVESALLNEAVATILLELRGWLSSRVGKAISQPSTIRTDARLTVFALRNVGDNIEAAVLALSAQSMAFRRALEVSDSLLAIDESPILFKYNGIAQIIGQVCANGAKSGIRPLIIGQDPDTIAQSVAGSQILQNLNTRLVGAIQPNALPSYQRLFGYDPSLLRPNTEESFRISPGRLCSHWLLDADARLTPCAENRAAATLFGEYQTAEAMDLNGDGFTEVTEKDFMTGGTNLWIYPTRNSRISANYGYTWEERRGGNRLDLVPHEAQITEKLEHRWHRGGLFWEQDVSSDFFFKIGGSLSHIERDSYYGGVGDVALPGQAGFDAVTYADAVEDARRLYGFTESTRYYFDSIFTYRFTRHTLSFGAQYKIDEVFDEKRNDANQPLRTDGSLASKSGENPIAEDSFDNLGFFIQEEWDPTADWTIIGGVRMDKHSELDDWVFSPRLAARYTVNSEWILRASVSTGFRAPEIFDEDFHIEILADPTRTRNAPDLKEESSVSFAAGFIWTPAVAESRLQVDVEYYRTEIEDTFNVSDIVFADPSGDAFKLRENAGGSAVQGLEANILYRFTESLSAEAGVNYTDARFDKAQEVIPGVFEEPYVESPRWSGVAKLNYLNEDLFDVFLGVVYTGPMIAVNEVDGYLNRNTGHFFVVDLSLKKHLELGTSEDAPHLDITLGVRNLFDERQDDITSGPNRDAGYFYGPRFPRSYFLTVTYHF